MEDELKQETPCKVKMNNFQWGRCAVGLHKRIIIDRLQVMNSHNSVIGVTLVSQCVNCGKIKSNFISTLSER